MFQLEMKIYHGRLSSTCMNLNRSVADCALLTTEFQLPDIKYFLETRSEYRFSYPILSGTIFDSKILHFPLIFWSYS